MKKSNLFFSLKVIWAIPFLFCLKINAQNNTDQKLDVILGIKKYRGELVKKNSKSLESYSVETLSESQNDSLIAVSTIKNLSLINLKMNLGERDLFGELEKNNRGQQSLFDGFSEVELDIIKQNIDLADLIYYENVIEYDYPFKILSGSILFKEFDFINIEPGQKVGEIGARTGTFAVLLGSIFNDVNFYINEMDSMRLEYVKEKLKRTESLNDSNEFQFVLGSGESGGFEGKQLDKIFLRNSFHHFDKKKGMLNSIKKSLKKDGELFINEKIGACRKSISKRKIIRIVRKAGFELEDQIKSDRKFILRFKKTALINE